MDAPPAHLRWFFPNFWVYEWYNRRFVRHECNSDRLIDQVVCRCDFLLHAHLGLDSWTLNNLVDKRPDEQRLDPRTWRERRAARRADREKGRD